MASIRACSGPFLSTLPKGFGTVFILIFKRLLVVLRANESNVSFFFFFLFNLVHFSTSLLSKLYSGNDFLRRKNVFWVRKVSGVFRNSESRIFLSGPFLGGRRGTAKD